MNNKGSAVAIVMLVLAVVSMIGVALLTQSRMDMQFTTSMKTYNEMVSLADGRATEALRQLKASYTYKIPPEVGGVASAIGVTEVPGVGFCSSQTKFVSYAITPNCTTNCTANGWQKGAPGIPANFHEEHYVIKGSAWKQFGYGTSASVPEAVIEIAVSVLKKD